MKRLTRSSDGFILPVTLWLIAAIGLVAALLSEWVSQAVMNAVMLQNRMESEIAFANVQNEIVFAFGRRPYSYVGLEVGTFESQSTFDSLSSIMTAEHTSDHTITLDGRHYVMDSNERYAIRLYDGRGLINLNTINLPEMERLLEVLNLSESDAGPYIDTLIDYRDEDEFERLSGAEKRDYERLGLPPPSDAKLLTPWEAQRVIGWSRLSELWKLQYDHPILTTCQVSGFNPNTAPLEALATYIDGISLEAAQGLHEHREKLPFRSIRNVGDAAGVILTGQPFAFSFRPSNCLIVELTDRETLERIRFSLSLLPTSKNQPWQIDYVFRIPKTDQHSMDGLDQVVRFPSPETVDRQPRDANGLTGL